MFVTLVLQAPLFFFSSFLLSTPPLPSLTCCRRSDRRRAFVHISCPSATPLKDVLGGCADVHKWAERIFAFIPSLLAYVLHQDVVCCFCHRFSVCAGFLCLVLLSDSSAIDLLWLKLHPDFDGCAPAFSSCLLLCPCFLRNSSEKGYSFRFCPQVESDGRAGCDGVTYSDMPTLVSTRVNQCQPKGET